MFPSAAHRQEYAALCASEADLAVQWTASGQPGTVRTFLSFVSPAAMQQSLRWPGISWLAAPGTVLVHDDLGTATTPMAIVHIVAHNATTMTFELIAWLFAQQCSVDAAVELSRAREARVPDLVANMELLWARATRFVETLSRDTRRVSDLPARDLLPIVWCTAAQPHEIQSRPLPMALTTLRAIHGADTHTHVAACLRWLLPFMVQSCEAAVAGAEVGAWLQAPAQRKLAAWCLVNQPMVVHLAAAATSITHMYLDADTAVDKLVKEVAHDESTTATTVPTLASPLHMEQLGWLCDILDAHYAVDVPRLELPADATCSPAALTAVATGLAAAATAATAATGDSVWLNAAVPAAALVAVQRQFSGPIATRAGVAESGSPLALLLLASAAASASAATLDLRQEDWLCMLRAVARPRPLLHHQDYDWVRTLQRAAERLLLRFGPGISMRMDAAVSARLLQERLTRVSSSRGQQQAQPTVSLDLFKMLHVPNVVVSNAVPGSVWLDARAAATALLHHSHVTGALTPAMETCILSSIVDQDAAAVFELRTCCRAFSPLASMSVPDVLFAMRSPGMFRNTAMDTSATGKVLEVGPFTPAVAEAEAEASAATMTYTLLFLVPTAQQLWTVCTGSRAAVRSLDAHTTLEAALAAAAAAAAAAVVSKQTPAAPPVVVMEVLVAPTVTLTPSSSVLVHAASTQQQQQLWLTLAASYVAGAPDFAEHQVWVLGSDTELRGVSHIGYNCATWPPSAQYGTFSFMAARDEEPVVYLRKPAGVPDDELYTVSVSGVVATHCAVNHDDGTLVLSADCPASPYLRLTSANPRGTVTAINNDHPYGGPFPPAAHVAAFMLYDAVLLEAEDMETVRVVPTTVSARSDFVEQSLCVSGVNFELPMPRVRLLLMHKQSTAGAEPNEHTRKHHLRALLQALRLVPVRKGERYGVPHLYQEVTKIIMDEFVALPEEDQSLSTLLLAVAVRHGMLGYV